MKGENNMKLIRLVLALLILVMVLVLLIGCSGGKCTVMCCKTVTIGGHDYSQCNAYRSDDCSCPGNYSYEYTVRDRR